jgi:endonuclease YncB( thermonuclease family)
MMGSWRDRRIALAIAVVVAVIVLLGCGSPGEGTTPSVTATPTGTSTFTPSPVPQPTSTAIPARTGTPAPTATSSPAQAYTPAPGAVTARVVNIVDGDTIDIEIEGKTYRVRYIGMDTPERGRPFFSEATEANRQLVEGKTVVVEKDVSDTDRYGRLLLYVYLEDGTFVNAELVRLGYAQVATYPPDVKHQDLFVQLQREAREAGRGLWAEAGAAATSVPTATPQPAATSQPPAQGEGSVIIKYVFYDGVVYSVESDEYAEIANTGDAPVNIGGWRLNAGDRGQDFAFPDFDLQPGQSCRVYTDEHHPEYWLVSSGFRHFVRKASW